MSHAPHAVARRRPAQQLLVEHEVRLAVLEHERAVGELLQPSVVQPPGLRARVDPLVVQPCVDRVRSAAAGVHPGPQLAESDVVHAAAERARSVPGGERRRLVEEEQLGELARLEEPRALPAAELEPARDPASRRPPPPDPPCVVVEATAVPVDETARGIGDEVAEGRDAVLQGHVCYVNVSGKGSREPIQARKPTRRWLPSQNGLFRDAPQRQSASRVSSRIRFSSASTTRT